MVTRVSMNPFLTRRLLRILLKRLCTIVVPQADSGRVNIERRSLYLKEFWLQKKAKNMLERSCIRKMSQSVGEAWANR
jgi:hypothetical protein